MLEKHEHSSQVERLLPRHDAEVVQSDLVDPETPGDTPYRAVTAWEGRQFQHWHDKDHDDDGDDIEEDDDNEEDYDNEEDDDNEDLDDYDVGGGDLYIIGAVCLSQKWLFCPTEPSRTFWNLLEPSGTF